MSFRVTASWTDDTGAEQHAHGTITDGLDLQDLYATMRLRYHIPEDADWSEPEPT